MLTWFLNFSDDVIEEFHVQHGIKLVFIFQLLHSRVTKIIMLTENS